MEVCLQGGRLSQKAVGLLCPVFFIGPQLVREVVLSCIKAVLQLLHENCNMLARQQTFAGIICCYLLKSMFAYGVA